MRAILLCTRCTNSTFGPEVVNPWLPSNNFRFATVHCPFMPNRPRVCLNNLSTSLKTEGVTAPHRRFNLASAFANCKLRFKENHFLISETLDGVPKHSVARSAIWASLGLAVSAYNRLHKQSTRKTAQNLAANARSRDAYCDRVLGLHDCIALSSGEQGSSARAAVSHLRAIARSSAAVPAMPEPGAARPDSSGSCQDQCGHLKCQCRSSGEPRCAHLWHPPLGGDSTGIHSPCRDCHYSTPPTSLNFTLRHVNADLSALHASSNVAYWLDSELDFPREPAYRRA